MASDGFQNGFLVFYWQNKSRPVRCVTLSQFVMRAGSAQEALLNPLSPLRIETDRLSSPSLSSVIRLDRRKTQSCPLSRSSWCETFLLAHDPLFRNCGHRSNLVAPSLRGTEASRRRVNGNEINKPRSELSSTLEATQAEKQEDRKTRKTHLKQVCRQPCSSISIEVGQGGRHRRTRDAMLDSCRDHTTPSFLRPCDLGSEEVIQEQVPEIPVFLEG